MKKIIAIFAVLTLALCLALTGCGAKPSESRFQYPLADIAEIEILSYSRTEEEQRVSYSDSDSLRDIYGIVNTLAIWPDAVALDPVLAYEVEIIVKYSNGSEQTFAFNDKCFLVDGKYYVLTNESVLVDSQYWPGE